METISICDLEPKIGQKIQYLGNLYTANGIYKGMTESGLGIVECEEGGEDLFEEYTTNFSRIKEILENEGLEVVYLDDYSGRGMLGKESEALVIDVNKASLENILKETEQDEEISKDIEEFLKGLCTDNMGKNSTIYYKK